MQYYGYSPKFIFILFIHSDIPTTFFKIPKIFINTCMYAQRPLCSSFRMPDVNFKMTMGQLLIFLIRQLTSKLRIMLWFVYFCCIYRSKLRSTDFFLQKLKTKFYSYSPYFVYYMLFFNRRYKCKQKHDTNLFFFKVLICFWISLKT